MSNIKKTNNTDKDKSVLITSLKNIKTYVEENKKESEYDDFYKEYNSKFRFLTKRENIVKFIFKYISTSLYLYFYF